VEGMKKIPNPKKPKTSNQMNQLPTHNKLICSILNTDKDGTVLEANSHSTITSNEAKLL